MTCVHLAAEGVNEYTALTLAGAEAAAKAAAKSAATTIYGSGQAIRYTVLETSTDVS